MTKSEATVRYVSQVWVLNKRGNQRFEVAKMKFLRQLLRFTKLGRQRNRDTRKRLQFQNTMEGIQK